MKGINMTGFSVHTAETLLGVAELHWRAANKAALEAQDEYDTARRLYTSARSNYVAAQGGAAHHSGAEAADAGE
jgi:ABC-type transporter lipoprotein component MlaA